MVALDGHRAQWSSCIREAINEEDTGCLCRSALWVDHYILLNKLSEIDVM